jgi:5-methyltetrahydrofolate--homocysteine methyltransferase
VPLQLREALATRVVVADGAMGTMLQAHEPTLADFEGQDGCNEVLSVSRPDIVRSIHDAYLAVGCDAVETNTFGANLAALGEYGIADRIHEFALASARLAREVADGWSTPERPRWVLGSVGPGTKLPTLGHVRYAELRDAYEIQTAAMVEGGVDAVLIETVQDLLQARAAVAGAKRALRGAGSDIPIIVSVTVETTGTMLLGSEIGAALTTLEPLGIDLISLNCATGPGEMSEHLRQLARYSPIALGCLPNAGLPQLTSEGASYPLTPAQLADAQETFVADYGLSLVGGCCGTTPEHLRQVADRVRGREVRPRTPVRDRGVASLYQHVSFDQDSAFLAIGERTNANGSRAFRDAMLAGDSEACLGLARDQLRDGAHLLDLCVDYVGRDGVADMDGLAASLATAVTLPVVVDSTEPAVVETALQRLPGRSVVNSVNYEDGDGPRSRMATVMPIVREHGAAVIALTIDEQGQARTAEWKVAVADRLIADLTGRWGMAEEDILVDCLTFPVTTGQEETRRDAIETSAAIAEVKARHPRVHTTLGVSNVSFGVNPAARAVLNSVFLDECVKAGLDSAIVSPSKIMPIARIPDEQRVAALDLIHDRRREGYDPLTEYLAIFDGVTLADTRADRAAELAALPLSQRLSRRIVDGERPGLTADLDEALATGHTALEIVNDELLAGMRTVGELFGSGQMQLPFVLQSAETMKAAVAHLEPHMERRADGSEQSAKATIVLATVRGDVHDIGKNLVDIILTNNGYKVVNLGIKQPISAILEAADTHDADVIGMSGLLVKSTVIMKENLAEMNDRGVAARWPVLLGGAALTRAYVENDLAAMYAGEVRYARDAFEGLRFMDSLAAVKRGEAGAALPPLRPRRVHQRTAATQAVLEPDEAGEPDGSGQIRRSEVATDVDVPVPPFWGSRVVKGLRQADYAAYLDERATFLGQWGLRGSRDGAGPSYEQLVETEGRPRLREWLQRLHTDSVLEAAVVYGYWPCNAEGQDLVVYDPATAPGAPGSDRVEIARFDFPRQRRDRRLCLSDFFRPVESGELDVIAFQLVTVGSRVSEVAADLFAADRYRDYLELHGLSVQLTEALAEYWHARIREELGLADSDSPDLDGGLRQGYRGSRYSFGYPACPDLEDRADLVRLLEPERIGVTLSEELQLHPEQSTDALVVHHPEAKYFNAT